MREEDTLQRDVAKLLDLMGWRWNHCPNGGRRGKVEAARLKGAGVKAGVPDVMIYEPWQLGFGVAIELKSAKGTATPNQKKWLADLETRGWHTAICRNLAEVVSVIKSVRPVNGQTIKE